MQPIRIVGFRDHAKASERYADVVFTYDGGRSWEGAIPIVYRRTGTDLQTQDEIDEHLLNAYEYCNPTKWDEWKAGQADFWAEKPKAVVTRAFFEAMTSFAWCCNRCALPSNPNPQRRIQDIKECGYTLATNTSMTCPTCGENRTHHLLVPLPRGGISGYEAWSPEIRTRIVRVFGGYDPYEDTHVNPHGLLPDHKFPEIRWDAKTRRESLAHLTDGDIARDFQLLSNQRNQQKREACRQCFQTGIRKCPFGIEFFYAGTLHWPEGVPPTGKAAEDGCRGCGWYDMAKWRAELNKALSREGRS